MRSPESAVSTSRLPVEVRRSGKRKRTVSADIRDGVIRVSIPGHFSTLQEREWVERMVARMTAKYLDAPTAGSAQDDLLERAEGLARTYLGGRGIPTSITWVTNQNSRWASATPAHRSIRLSHRLRGMPDWVQTVTVTFPSGRTADEVCATELATIVWMANLGTLRYLLVTPVLATELPALGCLPTDGSDLDAHVARFLGIAPFPLPFNGTGQPAISLPLHWTPGGLPVGIQFVGRLGQDASLLHLAARLEEARNWFGNRPTLREAAPL